MKTLIFDVFSPILGVERLFLPPSIFRQTQTLVEWILPRLYTYAFYRQGCFVS